ARPVQSPPKRSDHANGEPERLAGGVKLDIGNPVALPPAQAGLFILVLEGWRRASEQRRLYILECVDADDGVEAAVDSAGDHRHHATGGAHVKLGGLWAERVFLYAHAIPDAHRAGSRRAGRPNTPQPRAGTAGAGACRDF